MAASSQIPQQPITGMPLRLALHRAFQINAPLTIVTLAMIPIAIAALVGLIIDTQLITGSPAWTKPLKFAISTAIYGVTLLFLLTRISGHRRLVQIIGTLSAIGLGVELTVIPMQVIRGTTSHFNASTPFDATVYYLMAGFIVVVFFMGCMLGILLLRERGTDNAFHWALSLGLLGVLLGMAIAALMTTPNAAQLALVRTTGSLPTVGAHTVGAIDGGPGLPFFGWSTLHGDIRVPHFFGLHTIQVMIFLGWLLGRTTLATTQRIGITVSIGLGYIGTTGLLTWQALRGQSVIAPDSVTLIAMSALFVLVVMGCLASVFFRRAPTLLLSNARSKSLNPG